MILAFTNQKGGVGKTTSSVNVAAILASERKRKTLLIDADPQANTTSSLGFPIDELMGMHEVLVEDKPLSEVVEKTSIENLDLVPAAEDDTHLKLIFMQRTNAMIHTLKGHQYDEVIIDCGPHLDALLNNVLMAADKLITPIHLESLSLRGLAKLQRTIAERHREGAHCEFGGVLRCRVKPSLTASKENEAILQQANIQCLETTIREDTKINEASNRNQPVITYAPNTNGSRDYRALVEEIYGA